MSNGSAHQMAFLCVCALLPPLIPPAPLLMHCPSRCDDDFRLLDFLSLRGSTWRRVAVECVPVCSGRTMNVCFVHRLCAPGCAAPAWLRATEGRRTCCKGCCQRQTACQGEESERCLVLRGVWTPVPHRLFFLQEEPAPVAPAGPVIPVDLSRKIYGAATSWQQFFPEEASAAVSADGVAPSPSAPLPAAATLFASCLSAIAGCPANVVKGTYLWEAISPKAADGCCAVSARCGCAAWRIIPVPHTVLSLCMCVCVRRG